MSDLVEFLRARLDEDQWIAEGAAKAAGMTWEAMVTFPAHGDDSADDHIVRHDPARVLRDVGAKRRIVNAYETAAAEFAESGPAMASYDRLTGSVSSLRHALALLALPYADHPDYQQEWRP